MMMIRQSLVFALLAATAESFLPVQQRKSTNGCVMVSTTFLTAGKHSVVVDDEQHQQHLKLEDTTAKNLGLGALLALSLVLMAPVQASLAVSGGGLDYANMDITGQDFSNNSNAYKGKDFTQVIAKGTNFAKSNLRGCRFYKAFLVRTYIYICQVSTVCMWAGYVYSLMKSEN
jgi:uncharacterized protein YjbI with pentapeptide repeats